MSQLSCEMNVRVGGTYRLVFRHDAFPEPMAFFGRYLEVTPHARLVWTNDEGGEDGAVTTVTFEERGAETLVVIHDLYSSKEALDAAIAAGSTGETSKGTIKFSARAGLPATLVRKLVKARILEG
jgi:uncharacterized protein YndB with AHSA1/START domain